MKKLFGIQVEEKARENDTEKVSSVISGFFKAVQDLVESKKKQYNRVMPFGEYISDRWDKASCLGFGKGSSVYDNCYVYGDVSVGEDVWVGPFTILDGSAADLVIEDKTQISAGCQIYTHDSSNAEIVKNGPVYIGNNCYLGPNVVVTCGVTIGDNVTIGANSFVNRDIPANSKAYGNPVKVKGEA